MNPVNIDLILSRFRANGFECEALATSHLPKIKHRFEELKEKNLLAPEFLKEYNSFFTCELPADFPDAKSIILLAFRDSPYEFIFHWQNKTHKFLVPPTYLGFQPHRQKVESIFSDIFKSENHRFQRFRIPIKTTAVYAGLGHWGRNNILYVRDRSSYYRLDAYLTDISCSEKNWHEPALMDACKKCNACLTYCPTHAISNDRTLLYVTRCLTYHNEHENVVPFPDWIDPKWHNTLVGCLVCQNKCPVNATVKSEISPGLEFSEAETEILLHETTVEKLPEDLRNKMHKLEMESLLDGLPRNLHVLLTRV